MESEFVSKPKDVVCPSCLRRIVLEVGAKIGDVIHCPNCESKLIFVFKKGWLAAHEV